MSDDFAGSRAQIGSMARDQASDRLRIDVLVHAVGGQDEDVAGLGPHAGMVDLHASARAECPAEIGFLRRQDEAVILGQLLQGAARNPADPPVADVEEVGGAALEDEGAEGGDVAAVGLVPAAPRLGVEPGIGRRDHALRRTLHRPCVGCVIVVGKEALDRSLTRDVAHRAAADPVRDHNGRALEPQSRLPGDERPVKILVVGLTARRAVLAEREPEVVRHRGGLKGRGPVPLRRGSPSGQARIRRRGGAPRPARPCASARCGRGWCRE